MTMPSDKQVESIYRSLYRIRRTEETIADAYPSDKIKSPVHLSIGQEAIAVGFCEALQPEDTVFGTYRGHAMYMAKGGNLETMMAELYGKSTGCAKGKGGSMHLVDVEHGIMCSSAVVGTTIPVAAGYAYAQKCLGRKTVVVSFLGDGATEEGVFAETMNFAALKKLPIIFVCENNLYAIHTHLRARQAQTDICTRVEAHGVHAEKFVDDDVLAIYQRAREAVDALRTGETGPLFFECMTYRWKEHVGPGEDYDLGYRTLDEARPWMERDQMKRLAAMIPETDRKKIEGAVEAEIRDAVDFAEKSPFPESGELLRDVFEE